MFSLVGINSNYKLERIHLLSMNGFILYFLEHMIGIDIDSFDHFIQ